MQSKKQPKSCCCTCRQAHKQAADNLLWHTSLTTAYCCLVRLPYMGWTATAGQSEHTDTSQPSVILPLHDSLISRYMSVTYISTGWPCTSARISMAARLLPPAENYSTRYKHHAKLICVSTLSPVCICKFQQGSFLPPRAS